MCSFSFSTVEDLHVALTTACTGLRAETGMTLKCHILVILVDCLMFLNGFRAKARVVQEKIVKEDTAPQGCA